MDMSAIIVPKSDQINADDLLGRTMTITVTDVKIKGGQEQPISIHFAESEKVFRPCKSMCRVLAQAWGLDSAKYAGRSMTLYCDPTVKFGPLAVGGIRISHMSHIDGPMTMALTATKGVKKSFKVLPLETRSAAPAGLSLDDARYLIVNAPDLTKLEQAWKRRDMAPHREALRADLDDRKAALDFVPEGRADTDMGEDHNDAVLASKIAQELYAAADVDAVGAVMVVHADALAAMSADGRAAVHNAKVEALQALGGGK